MSGVVEELEAIQAQSDKSAQQRGGMRRYCVNLPCSCMIVIHCLLMRCAVFWDK